MHDLIFYKELKAVLNAIYLVAFIIEQFTPIHS